MPAPGARPHCHEVDRHAWDDPPVIGGLERQPETHPVQFADDVVQENGADQHPKPELPSFHKHIVPEVSDEPEESKEKTGSFGSSGAFGAIILLLDDIHLQLRDCVPFSRFMLELAS